MAQLSSTDLRTTLGSLRAALKRGRLDQTIDIVRTIVANDPPAEVLGSLGAVWGQLGEQWIAGGHTGAVIEVVGRLAHRLHAPVLFELVARAHLLNGLAARDAGRHDDAIAHYERAAKVLPDHALPWVRIGHAHLDGGALDKAQAAFEQALTRAPDDESAIAGLGIVHERSGDAQAAFDRLAPLTVVEAPHPSVAVGFAAAARRLRRPAEALDVVHRARSGARTDREQQLLAFAEGDLLDALGRYDDAFGAFAMANRLAGVTFDGPAFRVRIRAQIDALHQDRFARLPTSSCCDESPVLIVGMPRTGTSLVEQMLTRHPEVAGAGELSYWRQLAEGIVGWTKAEGPWYTALDRVTPSLLDTMAAAYLERLRDIGGPKPRFVTDKMPQNALFLAAVALACPATRVIHCVRDPRDAGWSCFRQPFFGTGLAFSTSLAGIGHWARGLDELMAHQKRVLPLRFHTVHYEALVEDVEAEARAMCAFLDVPYDAACAAPHANPRHVATASYAQVRAAPHRNAIGKHRPYASHLGPLFEVLDAEG